MKLLLPIFLIALMCKSTKAKAQNSITLAVANKVPVDYGDIDIVLNLPDSNNVGYAPSDTINYRTNLKPSQNTSEWLKNFIDKQFITSNDLKAQNLLWILHDLSVGKNSSGDKQISFVKLKSDIYESGINETYELVSTFDSTWISEDSESELGQMITNAFLQLYRHSINKNDDGNPSSARYKNLTKGAYNSIDGNRQSNRSQTETTSFSSFRKIENAWGIAVNNEIYFYSRKQLYPVEKWGNT